MFTNRYIFTYATIMILIVAAILATVSNLLSPFQDRNIEIEKIKNILSVAKVLDTDKKYKPEEIYNLYYTTISYEVIVNNKGEVLNNVEIPEDGNIAEGADRAFNIDMAKEIKKSADEQRLPVFIANIDGKSQYIIPLRGKGLWGPIWGFFSIDNDGNTLLGANFGHKGETPGLGAEIDKPKFGDLFIGKKIFDENGEFKSIIVVKGGASPDDLHGVDAISGGTITSNGVTQMISDNLKGYEKYFKNLEK